MSARLRATPIPDILEEVRRDGAELVDKPFAEGELTPAPACVRAAGALS
jgi:hypothetical protein